LARIQADQPPERGIPQPSLPKGKLDTFLEVQAGLRERVGKWDEFMRKREPPPLESLTSLINDEDVLLLYKGMQLCNGKIEEWGGVFVGLGAPYC